MHAQVDAAAQVVGEVGADLVDPLDGVADAGPDRLAGLLLPVGAEPGSVAEAGRRPELSDQPAPFGPNRLQRRLVTMMRRQGRLLVELDDPAGVASTRLVVDDLDPSLEDT